MSSRDPAEPPQPASDGPTPAVLALPEAAASGPGPEAAPARNGRRAASGAVLSLDERKAERRRQRAREIREIRESRESGSRPRGTDLDDDGFDPPAPAAPRRPEDAAPPPLALPQTAGRARARPRHWGLLLSFLLLVVAPVAVSAWYLWERAAPRYASFVGFSVRTEEAASPLDALSGMMALGAGGSSSSDTDILYRFIQSQEIVEAIDARLDLRALWAKGDPEVDPVFAYNPPGTIEDLHDHWERMVSVYNDTSTGLIDIEVQAFAPEDARAIAQAIFEESQALINKLSDIAQEDTTRLARDELEAAVERLKAARAAMTRFRNETQIVDPMVSIQSQMGLLSSLEAQLAQTLIDLDLLRQSAPEGDPRIEQALARVGVIEARMEEERQKLGLGRPTPGETASEDGQEPAEGGAGLAPQGEAFADLVGEYEDLAVDQEFAQQAYVAAMAAYDSALAEGRQQSRYLAAHVAPTLAERAEYPQRWTMTLLTALLAFLAWSALALTAYALKDRR